MEMGARGITATHKIPCRAPKRRFTLRSSRPIAVHTDDVLTELGENSPERRVAPETVVVQIDQGPARRHLYSVHASRSLPSCIRQHSLRLRQVRECLRKATAGNDEKAEGVACHEEKKAAEKRRGILLKRQNRHVFLHAVPETREGV